jgi:hypothetical protein
MTRNRVLILVVVVLVFLGIGGYLIATQVGGGGQAVSLNLTVTGDKISPENPTVKQGDRVTMTITADKAEEIHLHEYDIPFVVPGPGKSVTKTFTASITGQHEMEIEETSTHLTYFTVKP